MSFITGMGLSQHFRIIELINDTHSTSFTSICLMVIVYGCVAASKYRVSTSLSGFRSHTLVNLSYLFTNFSRAVLDRCLPTNV